MTWGFDFVTSLLVLVLVAAGLGVLWLARRRRVQALTKISVASGDQELMSLSALSEAALPDVIRGATKLDPKGFGGVLEPIMQVAPSMATATMANGRRLMEVVVNGPLVGAADGNGMRAISMGPNGIAEHARLYNPSALQGIANATAVWQLASVIVAQKHLADISETLRRVESKVEGVQSFMEEQRLAVVRSVVSYLQDAKEAIENGEFLERTRDKLETFDIELVRVTQSLTDQINREFAIDLDRDGVGCKGEYNSARNKYQQLKRHSEELALCVEVRLANWYLCSLYPDRSKMLDPRLGQIGFVTEQLEKMKEELDGRLRKDCEYIDAAFTSESTIANRRQEVREIGMTGVKVLHDGNAKCQALISSLRAVIADRQATNRLVVESQNGKPTAVYLRREQPVAEIIRAPLLEQAV
jgi:hypothetical protein